MHALAISSGERFGKLVAVESVARDKYRRAVWLFRCDCGNTMYGTSKSVIHGKKTDCGCEKRLTRINWHWKNPYRIENGIAHVVVGSNGETMICDAEDWERLSHSVWRINQHGYALGRIAGKVKVFSRCVADCPDGMQVDHINRDPLDNRKCNLRIVTQFENSLNKKLRVENISGMTGVTWEPRTKKWRVQITKDGRSNWIGRFADVSEAKAARLKAEIQYFGRVVSDPAC